MAEIISVIMNKGGVGKTSMVTNISGALSIEKDDKVLIVDTDGQGNAAITFKYDPSDFENTIYDVLIGEKNIEDVIIRINENIDLVPANEDMNFLDFEILTNLQKYSNTSDIFKLLKEALAPLHDKYDYIIIDSPPSMGLVTNNVLVASDKVLLPFIPEVYNVKGLIRIIKAINEVKSKQNPSLNILGVVGMMIDNRTTLHGAYLQNAEIFCKTAGIKLFRTTVPRSIVFANANAYDNMPAVYRDRRNKATKAYFELLEEMLSGTSKERPVESVR